MSARPAAGVVGVRSANVPTMVSCERARKSVWGVLAGGRLSAPFRLSSGRSRNVVWLAPTGQPSGSAVVATSPSLDRTGAVLREKSTGPGSDVLQQPAVGVADESVGRQRGVVAHDGVVGPAAANALVGAADAAPDGTGTT